MLPLISIVTVTYNASATIVPTLHSVRSQTFNNFEHLIVDGASTDDTLMLARREGRSDLRIISEPDQGLYDAMNKGLRATRGKYILFLNSGDAFADPDTLQAYADTAALGPDIIYADTLIVDADRNVIGPRHLSAPDILTFESFSHGMLICHQAFMVRKNLAPTYNTAYRYSADYDWTVRCIARATPSQCVNLHRNAIHYLADGLTNNNHTASLAERFKIMCHHYGTIKTVKRHLEFIPRAIKRKLSN